MIHLLPTFICPGAARCATTALYYLLIQHPQIYLPSIKETRFFALDYDKGLPWYKEKYYNKVNGELAIGDISPLYLSHDECPKRIYNSLGEETKFIMMLRNPVERIYSHYNMLRNHQFENLPLIDALQLNEKERIRKSLKYYGHEYGFQYLKDSSYLTLIKRYFEYFKKSQFKFVIFEEFIMNTATQLANILGFLGLSTQFLFNLNVYRNQAGVSRQNTLNRLFYCHPMMKKIRDFIQVKTSWQTQSMLKKMKNAISLKPQQQAPAMDEELEKALYAHYHDEIVQLEDVLGRDLSLWKKSPAQE